MGDVPEMVERVARAVALQDCCDPDFVDTKGRVQWTYHVELARAAIVAMREPSHRMMVVGDGALETETDNPPSWEAWRSMIDAALASPPKE